MGPTGREFSDLPAVPGVDHAPDHAARAREFVERHPHVSLRVTPSGWVASWTGTGPASGEDGSVRSARREVLGHLLDYLEARFDRRPS
jgi:hypothetical protein